jgi:ATP-binding cassette subfamily B protein RaxB
MKLGGLAERLKFSFERTLPMMLQSEVAECGLACIAMIAHFYGYQTDLLTLRRKYSISLKGSSLHDLIQLAKKFRLLSRALQLEINELKNLRTPCILHWDLDHFVVLKKVHGNIVTIHDPAVGIVKYTIEEVSQHFTGIALELYPAKNFAEKTDQTKLYLSDLWSSFSGLKSQLTKIFLISICLEIFEIISPLFIQLITDDVVITKDFPLLYVLSIGFGLVMLAEMAANYARSWIIMHLSNSLNIELVANLIHHLLKLPMDYFEKRHMGDIISRFESISTIQEKISTDFVVAIVDGIMIIITLIMMMIYSITLTLIVIGGLSLYIIMRLIFYPAMRYNTQQSIVTAAKEQTTFMETIRAILPVKIFGKELVRESVWLNCFVDKLNSGIRVSKLNLLYQLVMKLIFGLEYILVITIGAKFVIDNNSFSIGMLMAYLAYRQQFVTKAQNFVEKIIQYKMIAIHLERVADIALSEPEQGIEAKFDVKDFKHIEGEIKAENLSFRYSDNESYLFKNLNFHVKKGEVLAIIGSSGSGKTTLMKILLHLLLPTKGKVYIDNVELNKIGLQNYRSQIAAVMQDDTLLSGSIADNISFFDPNPDSKWIATCAMIAAIHNDIEKMPMVYSSLIGDMGTTLSGGQRQRVLLARALYSKPKILFLDESTSNLDLECEDIVNQHIKQIGITRIIISHRKEIIKIADQVVDFSALHQDVAKK